MIFAAIGWIGRQGTRALAASLLLGLLLPPLSAFMRPALPAAIFVLLVLAFLRVDLGELARRLGRPWLALGVVAWMMVATPLAVGALAGALGFDAAAPEIYAALVLMAAAPPIMSAPAICFLLGLDGALSLAVLVVAMVATPLTAPVVTEFFLSGSLTLSSIELAVRLGLYLAGSILISQALRRLLGPDRIAAAKDAIDGLNVILLFVFAVAIMDGVALRFLAEPGLVIAITLASFAVSLSLMAATRLAFVGAGPRSSTSLSVGAGMRNMGLMLAALSGHVPDLTWVCFALAQFPIYLLPAMLKPVVGRLAPVPT